MLTYSIYGPTPSGLYYAGYQVPGSTVFTVLHDCNTLEDAQAALRTLRQQAEKHERSVARTMQHLGQFTR